MMKKIVFILFCVLLFTQQSHAAWLQGKPLPEQKSFWVFETSLKFRVSESNIRSSKGIGLASAELGYLRNLTPKKAVGVSLYVSGDDDGSLFALRYRHRLWLESRVSLEFSPGIVLAGSDNYIDVKIPSAIGSVSLNIRDLVAFDFHIQAIRYSTVRYDYYYSLHPTPESGTQTSVYFGARFGSYAMVATAVCVIVVGVIAESTTEINYGI